MEYKLIAMDMDDTLLNSRIEISPKVKETIYEVRKKGILVTIATGRMFTSTLPYARQLEIDLPLITYNGAYIKNSLTGEELLHQKVPFDLARDILITAYENNMHINVYINDKLYVEKKSREADEYYSISGVPYQEVGNLVNFMQEAPTKLLITEYDEERLNNLKLKLEAKYQGKVYLTTSKPFFLEFINPLANKANALDFLAKRHGIKREEIMAIGDSYNDLEMIEYAGLGVVMGNAKPEIKAKADYVTCGNDEDGVAEAIRKFCL